MRKPVAFLTLDAEDLAVLVQQLTAAARHQAALAHWLEAPAP